MVRFFDSYAIVLLLFRLCVKASDPSSPDIPLTAEHSFWKSGTDTKSYSVTSKMSDTMLVKRETISANDIRITYRMLITYTRRLVHRIPVLDQTSWESK